MKKDDPSFQILFSKYTRGEASPEETARLFHIISENNHDEQIAKLLESELESTPFAGEYDPAWELTLGKIKTRISEAGEASDQKKTVRIWPRIAAIAAAVVLIAFGVQFFTGDKGGSHNYDHLAANDIAPGKVGATLTLSDGKKIRLDDAVNGIIAREAGISVSKTGGGQVVYQIKAGRGDKNMVHTLATTKGETYVLTLPDQTKVWLNAASSLTYNTALVSNGVRRVKLTGEAYFEVAKDKDHPFVVESGDQKVEVLGTHFNVNAYSDEKAYRTTLLEGSVKVSEGGQSKILSPGSQAVNSGGDIKLNTVDTDLAVAWKNNNFIFDRLNIRQIMRIIERWYDVEVVYDGEVPAGTFWGSVSRFGKVSQVLIPLEATGNVHFRIEGRTIYVSR